MIESSENNTLSEEEFITFLLIYASHIDYEFSQNEKDLILSKTDQVTFNSMINLFGNNNDYNCMRILLNHKEEYFNTTEKQEQLYQLLEELFKIDNDFSRIEKTFIPFFKKMIESKI